MPIHNPEIALVVARGRNGVIGKDGDLPWTLERLGRHRSGLLLFDRQALQGLRVTVMLPFDDPARALRLLQRTLPIEVSNYTPWVTRVSLKNSANNSQ